MIPKALIDFLIKNRGLQFFMNRKTYDAICDDREDNEVLAGKIGGMKTTINDLLADDVVEAHDQGEKVVYRGGK